MPFSFALFWSDQTDIPLQDDPYELMIGDRMTGFYSMNDNRISIRIPERGEDGKKNEKKRIIDTGGSSADERFDAGRLR